MSYEDDGGKRRGNSWFSKTGPLTAISNHPKVCVYERAIVYEMERPKSSIFEPPENWQKDNLSRFLTAAQQNTFAVFQRQPELWSYLAKIEAALDELISEVNAVPPNVDLILLERMHFTYLSALRLFTSLQYPDTFVVLRSALEYGLYEFYLAHHPDRRQEWKSRDDSAEAKPKKLMPVTLYKFLISQERVLGERVKELYDDAISAGAHPNPQAGKLAGFVSWTEDQEPEFIQSAFGQIYTPQFAFVAQYCAIVGITALELAAKLLPADAERLGTIDTLTELQRELKGVGNQVWDRIEHG